MLFMFLIQLLLITETFLTQFEGRRYKKNPHFQTFIASSLTDQIQELSLENKHFNLKSLTIAWDEHISP